jgi:predicted TIM-barrel fold metal-dependent hydrolase
MHGVQTIDFHQHFWPEQLIDALARRERPPLLRGSTLEVPDEGASEVDLGAHDLRARLALMDEHGIDVSVVSLAPTLGIASLEADEAAALVSAYEQGILELASASSGRIVPLAAGKDVEGFAGACIGAPDLLELDRGRATQFDELERRGAFLFVHPGPGSARDDRPLWWPAVVEYTAQMQAAYAAWLAEGDERWPGLRVVFAILAGGGPFQLERLQSRGVSGREIMHENVFFDTASYGRRALELCMSTFGVGQLLFGTDAPVLDPAPALDSIRGFGEAVTDTLCRQNPARLLARSS